MTDEQDTPSPLDQAVAQLAALVAKGPPPDAAVQLVGTIVSGWAEEPDMSSDVMQDRVGQWWDGLSTDAAALQEQLADAEGGNAAQLDQGRRVLAALNAAVATLAAISGQG